MALGTPINGLPSGTADAQQPEWDTTAKRWSIVIPHGGSAWPARVYAGREWFRTDRNIKYMRNAAGVWVPILSAAAFTLYVDGVNGTDSENHGFGSGANAFKTIQYAIDQIPGVVGGNVVIYVTAGTYAEVPTVGGKSYTGPYSIKFYGTRSVIESLTAGSGCLQGTGGAGTTSHQYAKVVRSSGTWTTNQRQNKWIRFTSGVCNGESRVIDYNDTTSLRPCGIFLGGVPANGDTFNIEEPGTIVTRGFLVTPTQQNVEFHDVDFQLASGTYKPFELASSGRLVGCRFPFASASSVWTLAGSEVTMEDCYFSRTRWFPRTGSVLCVSGGKGEYVGGANRMFQTDGGGVTYLGDGFVGDGMNQANSQGEVAQLLGWAHTVTTVKSSTGSTLKCTLRKFVTGQVADYNGVGYALPTTVLFGDDIMPNALEQNTATAANKLIDTSVNFTTIGVAVGDLVVNLTDKTYASVTAVDSATQLSLDADIFTAINKAYRILDQPTLCTTRTSATNGGQIQLA